MGGLSQREESLEPCFWQNSGKCLKNQPGVGSEETDRFKWLVSRIPRGNIGIWLTLIIWMIYFIR